MSTNQSVIQPSLDLCNKVKGAFVAQGKTLSSWCRDNEYKVPNVRSALIGTWNGKKAKELRVEIVDAACVELETE